MKAIEAFYIQLTATIPLSWKFASAPFHQKFYHISLENIVIYSVFATLFSKAISRFDYSLINKRIYINAWLFLSLLLQDPP